jgi:DNA-binding NtrC family response regulator
VNTADRRPVLTVFKVSESFADAWLALAADVDLHLETGDPAGVSVRLARPQANSVGTILACGGSEDRAIELLHNLQRAGEDGPIVVGAEPNHRLAVELMRRGAAAYYSLPADIEPLKQELSERAAGLAGARVTRGPQPKAAETFDFSEIVGEDDKLLEALDRTARIIPGGKATVLILGETGTGKELLARAIHSNGPRAAQPFVAVNCSAIPANLLESELFGHEKGAFTDARTAKPGLLEVADGGTVFLDEVATLSLELQAKMLRFLETREVRRVGGVRDKRVDVLILAAANVDLRSVIERGEFRDDLYYRLAVIPVELPPLRDRGSDVMLLARTFLSRLAEEYGLDVPEVTQEAARALGRHRWPGNVRELRNAIERSLLLSGGVPIRASHLALGETDIGATATGGGATGGGSFLPFPASLEELETAAAKQMLEYCDGNKSEAARRLGITRARLYRILGR